MKKIMFNEHFGLQQSVLDGTKDMTRRVIKGDYVEVAHLEHEGSFIGKTANGESFILPQPAYNVGEEVAIAQAYSNLREVLAKRNFKRTDALYDNFYRALQMGEAHDGMPGWCNKMFVKAEYMPHSISITATKLERLQDISDEDCLREGIYYDKENGKSVGYPFAVPFYYTFKGAFNTKTGRMLHWTTPREAYAVLIDKISGNGIWERNPYVLAYDFELVTNCHRLS